MVIIGYDELEKIASRIGARLPSRAIFIPPAHPSNDYANNDKNNNRILIFGLSLDKFGKPLSINSMREHLGTARGASPGFYNQDWYLKESFASELSLESRWYMVDLNVIPKSRGEDFKAASEFLKNGQVLPSAILLTYTFFVYYFFTGGKILWQHDFLWCRDVDHNGDQIYVGRYRDSEGVNKNGWNIHRHLRIRDCYGIAPEIKQ